MTVTTDIPDFREVRISPLSASHVLRGFRCGESALDHWVRNKALKCQKAHRSRIFCVHKEGSASVLGLYPLSMTSEAVDLLLLEERRHLQKGEYFPVIYIQILAVADRCQDAGLGTILLANALERSHRVSQNVVVFGVALRSLNDRTTELYERYGFGIRGRGDPNPMMILPIWSLNDVLGDTA